MAAAAATPPSIFGRSCLWGVAGCRRRRGSPRTPSRIPTNDAAAAAVSRILADDPDVAAVARDRRGHLYSSLDLRQIVLVGSRRMPPPPRIPANDAAVAAVSRILADDPAITATADPYGDDAYASEQGMAWSFCPDWRRPCRPCLVCRTNAGSPPWIREDAFEESPRAIGRIDCLSGREERDLAP